MKHAFRTYPLLAMTSTPAADGPPFRTESRTLDEAALDRMNEGREGDRAYQSFGRERHRILDCVRGYGSTVPDSTNLERWLTHPDERVPLLFFEHGPTRQLEDHPEVTHAFGRSVRARMREEGVVWTPVTDRAARAGWWAGGRDAARREIQEALGPWIQRQAEPEALEALTAFEFTPIARLVSHRGARISPALLDWMIEGAGGRVERTHRLRAVITRDALTEEGRQSLLDWAVGELVKNKSADSKRYVPASAGLEGLAEAEGGLPEDVRAELLRVGSDRNKRVPAPYAARALLADPSVPAGKVEAVADVLKRRADDAMCLIEHPNTPPRIAREVAEHHPTVRIRQRLAEQPRWRRDPAIGEILAGSRDVHVKAALALDREGRALSRSIVLLARRGELELALDVVRQRLEDGVKVTFSAEQLQPLLNHSLTEVRRAGLLLSQHLEARERSADGSRAERPSP